MKNKILKAVAFIIGVTINYWLIYTYFPMIWRSLHPLLSILILVMVIIILGLGSGIITAIESGYSGEIPKKKTTEAERNPVIRLIDWIFLYPLKLFVFTFLLYIVSSYYIEMYSNIYHNPEILKNIGGKSWPVILAPAFALMIVIAGGFIWVFKKINNNKAV